MSNCLPLDLMADEKHDKGVKRSRENSEATSGSDHDDVKVSDFPSKVFSGPTVIGSHVHIIIMFYYTYRLLLYTKPSLKMSGNGPTQSMTIVHLCCVRQGCLKLLKSLPP